MLTTAPVELSDHATLLAHSDGHPVPRWHLAPEEFDRAWSLGGAVGWTAVAPHGRALFVVGPDSEAASLAAAVVDTEPVPRVVVPRDAVPHLEPLLGDGWEWVWFWTDRPPSPRPGEAAARRLGEDDHDALAELLRVSSPLTSVTPGDGRTRSWWGVEVDGVLVACAAEFPQAPGVWHLRGVATHPRWRGRGLGADATAAVTRAAFGHGAHAVTLGMYADNGVAWRMYERLGFQVGQEFATRTVVR
ncbi:GNAT family N-acetyltransferase [Jiangella asiatica]|uniref:N-acetyltransferase n=1 Tax=Jiangella asiatica TaxID=2530372 RepID=A0A4R5CMR1_9ACTN|nr:GNAT family N-acetyltransferase [Jiangella asiatica]TDD99990.1 N-acetyltransferase [Jiangella asiatica]